MVIVAWQFGWIAANCAGLLQLAQGDGSAVSEDTASTTRAFDVWPSEAMLDDAVQRIADEAVAAYALTGEQRAAFAEAMTARWSSFLAEHRRALQPLIQEYFIHQYSPDPPDPETLRAWADRAHPILQQVRQQIVEGNGELAGMLDASQREAFAAGSNDVFARLRAFESNVANLRDGEYDIADWWSSPIVIEPVATGPAPALVEAGVADQISEEMSAWERYVLAFCDSHRLDAGQRRAAMSMLREQQQRAIAHRNAYVTEILRLEQLIRSEEGDDGELLHRELNRLYGPIDTMFRELDQRLKLLPTQRQQMEAHSVRDIADGAGK